MATKQKQSVLEKIREAMMEKAENAGSFSNEKELKLELDKTYVLRILPPEEEDEEPNFYKSHSYHYLQFADGGKYVFSKKMYGDKKDPIDEAVSQWYDLAEKNDDEDIKKIASASKRKRQYFMEVLLLKEDGNEVPDDKKYRILIDTSNDGKLVKKLCVLQGIPFFKDFEDNWVDATTKKIDKDKEYIDLIDMECGYDIKVTKNKTGVNTWDIDFDITPLKKQGPRELTKTELELIKERTDLKSYVKYIESYSEVEKLLNKFVNGMDSNDESEEEEEEQSQKPQTKKSKENTKVEVEEEEDEVDTPKKTPGKKLPDKKSNSKNSKDSEDDWDDIINQLDEEE
jgi:hypothetical protein